MPAHKDCERSLPSENVVGKGRAASFLRERAFPEVSSEQTFT